MIERHHGEKVVILIDEYDTPIQQGYTKHFYDEIIEFMRNFMSGGLKDNPSLAFGVLTGILRVSKENLFSGLNNLVVNSVSEEKYSEYFGFTPEEVTAIAKYYKHQDKLPEIQEWYDEFGTFLELALPNKEIRRVYNTEILYCLRNTLDGNVMAELEKSLFLSDGKKLQESLQKYMITCISAFDGVHEAFYHGMMLGLMAGMSSKYHILSNREAGEGRFDLVLEPKLPVLPAIIMELKASKDEKYLAASARKALNQITKKQYDIDLQARGISEIRKYGIAFCGKKVEIEQD